MLAAKKDGRRARTTLLSWRNSEQGDTHMEKSKTLAVDIGGTGIKAALLDENGQMIGKRSRVPTPPKPVAPEVLTATIDEAVSHVDIAPTILDLFGIPAPDYMDGAALSVGERNGSIKTAEPEA